MKTRLNPFPFTPTSGDAIIIVDSGISYQLDYGSLSGSGSSTYTNVINGGIFNNLTTGIVYTTQKAFADTFLGFSANTIYLLPIYFEVDITASRMIVHSNAAGVNIRGAIYVCDSVYNANSWTLLHDYGSINTDSFPTDINAFSGERTYTAGVNYGLAILAQSSFNVNSANSTHIFDPFYGGALRGGGNMITMQTKSQSYGAFPEKLLSSSGLVPSTAAIPVLGVYI